MALDLRIAGDKSETHERVKALPHAAYDGALGVHEITLAYNSGRGYQVLSSTRRRSPGHSPGAGALVNTGGARTVCNGLTPRADNR